MTTQSREQETRCKCCGGTVECAPECNGYDPGPEHEKDEDCTVDPETYCCTLCGVMHGDECFECKGRGFHRAGCSLVDGGIVVKVDADTV